jgi:hypothetical protein
VVIRTPIVVLGDVRHPDVAVGPLVDPGAVLVELFLVLLDPGGEVLPFAPLGELGVAAAVPVVERVGRGVTVFGVVEEPALGGGQGLPVADEDRAVFRRGFQAALTDEDDGLPAGPDIEPVEARGEDVEGRVGGMELDALLLGEIAHPEIGAAARQDELDALLPFPGQDGELDLGVVVEAEIVAAAEVDLGLAALGPDAVSLDEGEIDLSLLVAQTRGPLDVDRAVDIAQTGIAVGIITFILGREA